MKNKYVQVLVNIPNVDKRTFSYSVPEELKSEIKIGQAVLVPFGMQGAVNAFVVGFTDYIPEGIKAKNIYEILEKEPVFTLEFLQFLEWVSEYYCTNLPVVIETAVPMEFISQSKKIVSLVHNEISLSELTKNQLKIVEELKNKDSMVFSSLQRKVKFTPSKFYEAVRKLKALGIIDIHNIIDEKNQKKQYEKFVKYLNSENLTKRQLEIVDILKNQPEIKLSELLELAKTTRETIKKLADRENVEIIEKEVYRNPLNIFEIMAKEEFPPLNNEQNIAFEKIKKAFEEGDSNPFLLYGITGSGKTEVYFNAIKTVLEKGKTVIFLAPEIPVATQMAQRIAKRFGVDEVAVWHSSVSEGEKYDIRQKLLENKIKIITGARSAIFAPIKNVGLIIIDEEHETAYKQASPAPRYDARALARERAKRENAVLVLGSATPDINSYYEALNSNRVLLLQKRFGDSELAKVHVIDMKDEHKKGNRSVFSSILKSAISKNIVDKKQTIILINRRGFSTSTLCQSCGHVVECKKCAIPLILHKTSGNLRCHYCGYEREMVSICPECGSNAIRYSGMGTQKVEEYAKREFPNARIERIDSDILSRKNAHIHLLKDFSNGKIDILIGTQMIAKGLDNPNVTLVGVLMADQSFAIPDFRATERGFQLLTQVAGRAGRGDFQGRVYFQTYVPDFFALKDAQKQDYINFYKKEIKNRYELAYPPYSKMIRLILSSRNNYRAEKIARECAYRLKTFVENQGISEKLEILGPSECVISKIKDEYRYQILIKNRLEQKGHFMAISTIKQLNIPEDTRLLVDVDPVDML
jgi:primosomal protein N' (replication factor Y) (superfamily II helicase)